MIVLFDAGNTRLKWAIVNANHSLLECGSVSYSDLSAVAGLPVDLSQVSQIAVSSVAGDQRNRQIRQVCADEFDREPVFAQVTALSCGVKNGYLAQHQLGVDRWVAALGAADQEAAASNQIIVDAGTAVTIDVLDRHNEFQGGVILPGAGLMHDSLVGKTAGIQSSRQEVLSVIGRDTQACVNSGTVFGLAGAVDRIIDECVESIGHTAPWKVVVCGGDADWLTKLLKTPLLVSVQPALIFDGLLRLLRFGELN